MVRKKVENTMKNALLSFATKEGKNPNDISLFIHTKQEDLSPQYFYAIDGRPVLQDGKLKELDFTKDILGKKFDILGMEAIASQFLAQYFNATSRAEEADPKQLYVMITSQDKNAKDLLLALYRGQQVIKNLSLEDIFEG